MVGQTKLSYFKGGGSDKSRTLLSQLVKFVKQVGEYMLTYSHDKDHAGEADWESQVKAKKRVMTAALKLA